MAGCRLLYQLAWIAVVFWKSSVEGLCPSGPWVHYAESCYQFVQIRQNWNNALRNCRLSGATLTVIETEDENHFLRTYLYNNSREFYGYDMWLGGNALKGYWEWVNGISFDSAGFTDWEKGTPDHPGAENCLEFEAEFDNHWNDDFCDEVNYFICERPFQPITPPSLPIILIGR